ncbi:hypothetical protein ACLBNB_22770 [Pseudomonas chlororaphis subsp. aurantiaca]|uniref:hypothetical protein n=1 Tax=Pseudomonas chlororaphis TaxID=587753 RepID=UPI000F5818DF|nr:hypothetical protein [Pseudomonas chlororaphis]AZD56206.1 hypothetical protein C4K19_4433 [Pseudomonas chlororaphis subsp. aurantiaca]
MIFLSLFLIFVLSIVDGRISYLAVALFVVSGLLKLGLSTSVVGARKLNSAQFFIFIMPFFIFLSWCYGVLVGLLNGVEVSYVFSNFAGLSLYILFYIFYFSVDVDTSKKALFFSAICSCVFGFYAVYDSFASVGGGELDQVGLAGVRTLYSATFLYVAPFLFVCLVRLFLEKKYGFGFRSDLKAGFGLLVFGFILVVPAMSKGFILVFVLMMVFVFMAGYSSVLRSLVIGKNLFFMTFLVLLAGALLLFTDFYNIIFFSFSSGEGSNSIRSEQFDYLVSEWSFSGAGLGSSLKSGYQRDDTGYGFELTYINLINKLGVLSLPLFLSYCSALFFGFKFFFFDGKWVTGAWVLGLMAFLIPGAGNPLLLAPVFVFMHFIAMTLIIVELSPRRKPVVNRTQQLE